MLGEALLLGGPVTRGLTQYQLKFPGPFSIDFNNSLLALVTAAPTSPLHAEHGDTTFRIRQGSYSWKITFWAWEGQSVPKEHTRKPEKNVGLDQNGSKVVFACQKLNNS